MDRNTNAVNYGGNMGWVCPVCGKTNTGTAKFCTGCGTPMQIQNTGYVNRDTGYVSRDTGMYAGDFYGVQDGYVSESPKRKSGALKIIALALGCIVLAVGIGFGVSHFLLGDDDDTKSSDNDKETEQTAEEEKSETAEGAAEEEKTEPGYNPNAAKPEQMVEEQTASSSGFEVGGTYTVISKEGVKVRSTPEKIGERDNQLTRGQLPSNYYSQSEDGTYACLVKGSKVTCLEISGNWMKIMEGGWVCIYDKGEELVK